MGVSVGSAVLGLSLGAWVVGLTVGRSVGSGVPHKLPGGCALSAQMCSLNQSIPLDIREYT